MSANDTTMSIPPAPLPGPGPESGRAVHASGWLGSQSIFDRKDDRKIGRAMGASLAAHLALVAVLGIILTIAPQTLLRNDPPLEYKVVFLQEPGPGGGGGGSPAPAPPKPMEIPKHKAPEVAQSVAQTFRRFGADEWDALRQRFNAGAAMEDK